MHTMALGISTFLNYSCGLTLVIPTFPISYTKTLVINSHISQLQTITMITAPQNIGIS